MEIPRFDGLALRFARRLTRRTGLGMVAGTSLLLLQQEATTAKKKKKITLCFNGATIKKSKKSAKKLRKQGALNGACRCGNGAPCRVFTTSTGFTGGQVGGLAGADAKCNSFASSAGLPGTYKAWLSAGASTPATRFSNLNLAGPWVLPSNAGEVSPPIVASNFTDLVTCAGACLQHAIDRDEKGLILPGAPTVWTGTKADGSAAPGACANWTSSNNADAGLFGFAKDDAITWTESAFDVACNTTNSLYCFEQAT